MNTLPGARARLVESIEPRPQPDVGDVVDALAAANNDLLPVERIARGPLLLPSREALEVVGADLQAARFPAHFGAGLICKPRGRCAGVLPDRAAPPPNYRGCRDEG